MTHFSPRLHVVPVFPDVLCMTALFLWWILPYVWELTLDRRLCWKPHVDAVAVRCNKKLGNCALLKVACLVLKPLFFILCSYGPLWITALLYRVELVPRHCNHYQTSNAGPYAGLLVAFMTSPESLEVEPLPLTLGGPACFPSSFFLLPSFLLPSLVFSLPTSLTCVSLMFFTKQSKIVDIHLCSSFLWRSL